MLRYLLSKARELAARAREWKSLADEAFYPVRYLSSVPLWKPWHDYDLPMPDEHRER
jgi:hypothetical protein